MYNDNLKRALEETFRERMRGVVGEEQHGFSPEFERKMKKLTAHAKRIKVTDAQELKELAQPAAKKKHTAIKWLSVAACLCLTVVGGAVLVRMLSSNTAIPGDTSVVSDNGGSSEGTASGVEQIPAFIEYDGLSLPTAGAYKPGTDGSAQCIYDYAVVQKLTKDSLYYDDNERSPDLFNGTHYSAPDSLPAPETVALKEDESIAGMTVSDASATFSVNVNGADGTYYLSPYEMTFTLTGNLELNGILWNDPDGAGSKLLLIPDGNERSEELAQYIIKENYEDTQYAVPSTEQTRFYFCAASSYPLIDISDSAGLPENSGLYNVTVVISSLTQSFSRSGINKVTANVDSVEVTSVKSEMESGAEYPLSMPFYGYMMPTDAQSADGWFDYDYCAVRKLSPSELLYNSGDTEEPSVYDTEKTVLKKGDAVGDLTVTEAQARLKAMQKELTESGGGYNRLELSGSVTLKGMLGYDTFNGYVLCVDPTDFDTVLPYIPLGISGPYLLTDGGDNVAQSGYPPIYLDLPEDVDMSGFETDKTYNVTVTADSILFNCNDNSSFSGISAHAVSVTET